MVKVLRCRDLGYECQFEARAETEEELLRLAGEHTAKVHPETELTPEVIAAAKAAIRIERETS